MTVFHWSCHVPVQQTRIPKCQMESLNPALFLQKLLHTMPEQSPTLDPLL